MDVDGTGNFVRTNGEPEDKRTCSNNAVGNSEVLVDGPSSNDQVWSVQRQVVELVRQRILRAQHTLELCDMTLAVSAQSLHWDTGRAAEALAQVRELSEMFGDLTVTAQQTVVSLSSLQILERRVNSVLDLEASAASPAIAGALSNKYVGHVAGALELFRLVDNPTTSRRIGRAISAGLNHITQSFIARITSAMDHSTRMFQGCASAEDAISALVCGRTDLANLSSATQIITQCALSKCKLDEWPLMLEKCVLEYCRRRTPLIIQAMALVRKYDSNPTVLVGALGPEISTVTTLFPPTPGAGIRILDTLSKRKTSGLARLTSLIIPKKTGTVPLNEWNEDTPLREFIVSLAPVCTPVPVSDVGLNDANSLAAALLGISVLPQQKSEPLLSQTQNVLSGQSDVRGATPANEPKSEPLLLGGSAPVTTAVLIPDKLVQEEISHT